MVFPGLTVAALALNYVSTLRSADRRAFLASSAYIAGVLASIAAGLYPVLLPGVGGAGGLDIYNAAAPRESLRIALMVYLAGLAIVSVYLVNVYRVWKGKSGRAYQL